MFSEWRRFRTLNIALGAILLVAGITLIGILQTSCAAGSCTDTADDRAVLYVPVTLVPVVGGAILALGLSPREHPLASKWDKDAEGGKHFANNEHPLQEKKQGVLAGACFFGGAAIMTLVGLATAAIYAANEPTNGDAKELYLVGVALHSLLTILLAVIAGTAARRAAKVEAEIREVYYATN